MDKSFLSLLRLAWIASGLLLAGCATPFRGNFDRGPSPEDTIIKRDTSIVSDDFHQRTFAAPRRPEPEEILIDEPEVVVDEPEEVGAEYVVRKGDCLSWIAKKFHVKLSDLLSANSIDKNAKLAVGQKLRLPGVTQEQVEQLAVNPTEYTVQNGDCLSKIAHKYGLRVHEIKAANGMKTDRIIAGKKLVIPERGRYIAEKTTATPPAPKVENFVVDADGYYAVQKGDSLSKIASKAKVGVRDLQDWNRISDPTRLQIGQKLMVKRTPSVAASTVQPTTPTHIVANVFPEPAIAKEPSMLMSDADFFGSIDDIPVVQVQD